MIDIKGNMKRIHEEITTGKKELRTLLNLRFLSFIIVVLCYFLRGIEFQWRVLLSLLPLIAFLVLVKKSRTKKEEVEIGENMALILLELEEKKEGIFKGKDSTERKEKPFFYELDILGEVSLFSFLNQTETSGGKKRLLSLFLNPSKEDRGARFSSQEELLEKEVLLLSLRAHLKAIKDKENLDEHLLHGFMMKRSFSVIDFLLSALLNALVLVLLYFSLVRGLSPLYLVISLFISLASGILYQQLYGYELSMISRGVRSLRGLDGVFSLLSKEDFRDKNLAEISESSKEALKLLKGLKALEVLDSFRVSWILNTFLMMFFNFYSRLEVFFYHRFIKKDLHLLKKGLSSLFSFEMLMSLSTLGLLKKRVTEPEFTDKLLIDVEEMIYPLLEEEEMVSNSFKTGPGVTIITGSNMSGKTFFMKSLALNLYLSYLGSHVCAKAFKAPWLSLYSSINVKDDASKGISTFYAELLRVKEMLREESKYPKINFIDEIFKGTNAKDRLYGATETILELKEMEAFTFITTHDRELTSLEEKKVQNYYFEEDYVENQMVFDHTLKKGTTEKSNAKVLMKSLGIIE